MSTKRRNTKSKAKAGDTKSESLAIAKLDKSKPISSRPKKKEPGPMSVADIQNKMFENAGVSKEVLGGEAIRTARKLLKAKKTRYFADKGQVIDEREVEDSNTQLAASRLAGEMAQAMPKRDAGSGGGGGNTYILALPAWAIAGVAPGVQVIDQADVVDAERVEEDDK